LGNGGQEFSPADVARKKGKRRGGFKNVSELMNVQGIGEKNLARIQSYLTTGDPAKSAASK
jgi:ERCC4-type nuclease